MLSSWIRSLDITTVVGVRATTDPRTHSAPSRQQAHSCRVRTILLNTVLPQCCRCTNWERPMLYLYGSSDIIFLMGAQYKKHTPSHVFLPALQNQSVVSAYSFVIASQSIHQTDTVLLTQLHYVITLKGESYHKASILRFQIKSICVSNPTRPSLLVMVHESIYDV